VAKQFLRKATVAARYNVVTRTVERMVEDGRLPPPTYRGRIPLWLEDDLDAYDRAATLAIRPKHHTAAGSELRKRASVS
jgi:hypothetical protein